MLKKVGETLKTGATLKENDEMHSSDFESNSSSDEIESSSEEGESSSSEFESSSDEETVSSSEDDESNQAFSLESSSDDEELNDSVTYSEMVISRKKLGNGNIDKKYAEHLQNNTLKLFIKEYKDNKNTAVERRIFYLAEANYLLWLCLNDEEGDLNHSYFRACWQYFLELLQVDRSKNTMQILATPIETLKNDIQSILPKDHRYNLELEGLFLKRNGNGKVNKGTLKSFVLFAKNDNLDHCESIIVLLKQKNKLEKLITLKKKLEAESLQHTNNNFLVLLSLSTAIADIKANASNSELEKENEKEESDEDDMEVINESSEEWSPTQLRYFLQKISPHYPSSIEVILPLLNKFIDHKTYEALQTSSLEILLKELIKEAHSKNDLDKLNASFYTSDTLDFRANNYLKFIYSKAFFEFAKNHDDIPIETFINELKSLAMIGHRESIDYLKELTDNAFDLIKDNNELVLTSHPGNNIYVVLNAFCELAKYAEQNQTIKQKITSSKSGKYSKEACVKQIIKLLEINKRYAKLGELHKTGILLERHMKNAIDFYKKGCEEKQEDCYFPYAKFLYEGVYSHPDYENARIYFEQSIASNLNVAESYYYLGEIEYYTNSYDQRNLAKAAENYGLALRYNHPKAYESLKVLILENKVAAIAELLDYFFNAEEKNENIIEKIKEELPELLYRISCKNDIISVENFLVSLNTSKAYFYLYKLYREAGDVEKAREQLEEAASMDPPYSRVINEYTWKKRFIAEQKGNDEQVAYFKDRAKQHKAKWYEAEQLFEDGQYKASYEMAINYCNIEVIHRLGIQFSRSNDKIAQEHGLKLLLKAAESGILQGQTEDDLLQTIIEIYRKEDTPDTATIKFMTALYYHTARRSYDYYNSPVCRCYKQLIFKLQESLEHDILIEGVKQLNQLEKDQLENEHDILDELENIITEYETQSNNFFGENISDDSDDEYIPNYLPSKKSIETSKEDPYELLRKKSINNRKSLSEKLNYFLDEIDDLKHCDAEGQNKKYDSIKKNITDEFKQQIFSNTLTNSNRQSKRSEIQNEVNDLNKYFKRQDMPIDQTLRRLKNQYVIAQYRGVFYNTRQWNQKGRQQHRNYWRNFSSPLKSSLGSAAHSPALFSPAVYSQAGESVNDYMSSNRNLAFNDHLNDPIITPYMLEKLAKQLTSKIKTLSENPPDKEGDVFDNQLDLLRNLYTNNYEKFFEYLQRSYRKNELDFVDNPFVSTSDLPFHALKYAYGLKIYKNQKKIRLRPRFNQNQIAERPYSGLLFLTLHPPEDYFNDNVCHVVSRNHEGRMRTPIEILYEREASFLSYIKPGRLQHVHIAKYPSFHRDYSDYFLHRYGLEKGTYNKFKALFRTYPPHSPGRKATKMLLGYYLCAYFDLNLQREAQRIEREQGKILLYMNKEGKFNLTPTPTININPHPAGKNEAEVLKKITTKQNQFKRKRRNSFKSELEKDESEHSESEGSESEHIPKKRRTNQTRSAGFFSDPRPRSHETRKRAREEDPVEKKLINRKRSTRQKLNP